VNLNPHGAFGLKVSEVPKYTLVSMAGAWNYQCTKIYCRCLKDKIRYRPDQRRCAIFDGRRWGLRTPDSENLLLEAYRFIASQYRELHLAYILTSENRHLGRYILDSEFRGFDEVMQWKIFGELHEALEWLRGSGFDLPELTYEDFPMPVSANEYSAFCGD
jgi:hypothetical protein